MRGLPRPSLRPFVESVWAIDETSGGRTAGEHREHVIPTGRMHLVFRLSDDPLRLFVNDDDLEGEVVSTMLVGGARARYYARDVSRPLRSVGAVLRPGAAEALFGVHADDLAGRHTALEDLWGAPARSMRDELAAARTLEARLDAFERMLAFRLPTVSGIHPAVARALHQLGAASAVRHVVKESGYSHRRFITLFSRTVGLTPKMYCRVVRFQRALPRAGAAGKPLIEVAASAGYSDQAHFTREFREFAGVTPTEYRQAAPVFSHHVPVEPR